MSVRSALVRYPTGQDHAGAAAIFLPLKGGGRSAGPRATADRVGVGASLPSETALGRIVVAPLAGDRRRGLLVAGPLSAACAVGRAGTRARKTEGDGATPKGRFSLVHVFYRADRLPRPATRLPAAPIRPDLGWCDDPADRRYNRPVRLPCSARHERLWRDDHLYDVVVVLDYNLVHLRPGAGSAIFLHIAATDFSPTSGCIAVAPDVMRRLLARAGPRTLIDVR